MNKKYLIATSVAALLLVGSPLAWQALASDKAEPTSVSVEAKGGPTGVDISDMSQDGLLAMRNVFAARSAINDGQYEAAKGMLKTAQGALKKVATADKPTTIKSETKAGDKVVDSSKDDIKADLIPISGQFQIVEDFAPTPEKTAHMNKAHEHIKKGDTKSAIDELKLADVGVVFQRVEMPLVATQDHVNAAISLLNDGEYHEANMALKATEDGLQYNTVSIVTPINPQQPSKS